MGGGSTDTYTSYNAPGAGPGQVLQSPGGGGPISLGYQGMPNSFPGQSLGDAYNNIGNLYGGLGQIAPAAYDNALSFSNAQGNAGIGQINGITNQGISQQGALGQQAQEQISGLENQNMGQVNNLLNNYDQSFMQQLGPSGNMGQQLAGEYANYGITPTSGGFQEGLGNTLGQLGAQNALTLGQQALQPGINAQYNTLGSTLQGQLGTSQQGAQQEGQLSNVNTVTNQGLAQQGALAPLNYANQAAQQQSGIINQAAQLPIDYWGTQNNQNFAQNLSNQNQASQNENAQLGALGSFGSAALLAAAK